MKLKLSRVFPILPSALLLLGWTATALSPCLAQSYTVTDLGPSVITATAVNNNRQIVGAASPGSDPSGADPYILSNGTLTDVGNFGSVGGTAEAVNSLGDLVGITGTAGGGIAPFLFVSGALSQLPGAGIPLGINTAGTIVGYFAPEPSSPINLIHAFVIQNGAFKDLGQGELHSQANGINSSDQIVGFSDDPNNSLGRVASVWRPDGTMTLLGVLGTGIWKHCPRH